MLGEVGLLLLGVVSLSVGEMVVQGVSHAVMLILSELLDGADVEGPLEDTEEAELETLPDAAAAEELAMELG